MSNTVINTNVLALNSHRNLSNVGTAQAKSSARLSSGFKINSAADDAAGLAISEKMRAQVRGLDMSVKNTQDGASLIQTAEGGMQEVDNMLQRMRELVTQASNDTNENNTKGTGDRTKIQDEISQLTSEIDSMAGRVEFNGKKVIDGTYGDAANKLGVATAEAAAYGTSTTAQACVTSLQDLTDQKSTSIGGKSGSIAALGISLDDAKAAGAGKASLDAFTASISDLKVSLSDMSTCLTDLKDNLGKAEVKYLKAQAASIQKNAFSDMNTKGTDSLYFQIGANSNQGLQVKINSVKTDALGIGDGKGSTVIDVAKGSGTKITGYLETIDKALSYVTTERSKLGATQNRLEFSQKSLQVSSENLAAAESRVRDADMAKEMMNLTKSNVLQQAATSMLSQANQAPQQVLQLLR